MFFGVSDVDSLLIWPIEGLCFKTPFFPVDVLPSVDADPITSEVELGSDLMIVPFLLLFGKFELDRILFGP